MGQLLCTPVPPTILGFKVPYADGEMLPLYLLIKAIFTTTTFSFYHSVFCPGILENVPAPGTPMILCFNHANGLIDPKLLMRTCPRMIRFCAKHTLWGAGFKGTLIAASGAVPIRRRGEDGNTGGKQDNAGAFDAIHDALDDGQCISMAPEGGSSMQLHLRPFKPGVGIIAVGAMLRHMEQGDEGWKVRAGGGVKEGGAKRGRGETAGMWCGVWCDVCVCVCVCVC